MHGGTWKIVAVGSGLNGRLGALGFCLAVGHSGKSGEPSVNLEGFSLAEGVEETKWNEMKGRRGKTARLEDMN